MKLLLRVLGWLAGWMSRSTSPDRDRLLREIAKLRKGIQEYERSE